ncbi:hypothetical protein [Bacillus sp. 1P06AnD]|uniref:hypothetical protein n=1 Tax=Bacillus sp. 1P06AnD TaxID=3132208 RepID=UPI0039A2A83C
MKALKYIYMFVIFLIIQWFFYTFVASSDHGTTMLDMLVVSIVFTAIMFIFDQIAIRIRK